MKIGKIIIAAFLALVVAQALGLSSASAAAIIAILSVLDTRKSSVLIAWQRTLATVLALLVGVCVFGTMGYITTSFGVYLACYIPLAFLCRVEVGIAPSSVLAIHLWASQSTALALLWNELLLMLIGAGIAILLNWYMPSYQSQIVDLRNDVEVLEREILWKMERFLRVGDGQNDAPLIQEAYRTLEEARRVVYLEGDNRVFTRQQADLGYFEMRFEQVQLLEVMAKNLNDFHWQAEEAEILAELFHLTGEQLKETNPASQLKQEIVRYRDTFRQRELPRTREEFEYRAMLFQLLQDLDRFVTVKVNYWQGLQ